MKKSTIITISIILLLLIIVTGGTFAYFSAMRESNKVEAESSKFEVIYDGGEFEGTITLTSGKDNSQKLSNKVNIRMAPGSALAKATIYMNVEKISNVLAVKGFVWEVYGYKAGELVYEDKGDFYGINTTTNNKINIVEDYRLSEENTEFTIYLWLDGNQVSNEIIGAEFQAYIGAKTENFTGSLK